MRILIIDDGNKGNFIQSKGLSLALKPDIEEIYRVEFLGPHYRLPYRKGKYSIIPKIIGLCLFLQLTKFSYFLFKMFSKKPFLYKGRYDFVITAGSYLAPLNIIISRKLKAKSIQIMVPSGVPLSLFDILIVPYPDYLRMKYLPKNAILTVGVPNCVSKETLEKGEKEILKIINVKKDDFIIGVLIGGNDQNYKLSVNFISELIFTLMSISNFSRIKFLFSTSPRTPEPIEIYLEKILKKFDNVLYLEIPRYTVKSYYYGILAISNILIVTEDSMNMISESLSAGKPLLIIGVERRKEKKLIFDKVIEHLVKEDYAEYLPLKEIKKIPILIEKMKNKKYKKLNDAEVCAAQIMEKFKNEK